MSRFYIDADQISGKYVYITGEDLNHIRNVLRLKRGDIITVCDGWGTDYQVKLENYEKEKITASIIKKHKNKNEAPIDISLYQGVPKSEKMNIIIQKSVELGVNSIIPVITKRTVVRFKNEDDIAKKQKRWQRIALEAAKQCGRGIIPKIKSPVKLDFVYRDFGNFDLVILPYELETCKSLKAVLMQKKLKKIAIIIGPEGGFAAEEVQSTVQAGAASVSLGPRILRTETAGPAVLAIIMYQLGDI